MELYPFNQSQFVLYKKEGVIQSGGFSLKGGFSKKQRGGGTDAVKPLPNPDPDIEWVVPSGLYHSDPDPNLQSERAKRTANYEDAPEENHTEIPDDVYENLLNMASVPYKQKGGKYQTTRKLRRRGRLQRGSHSSTFKKFHL